MQASPSKARAQALETHAWSLVTSWLSELYHPLPTPAFERNAATLRALQSLMAENTAADKLRRLLYDAQCEELEAAKKAEVEAEARLGGAGDDGLGMESGRAREEILQVLESSLSHPASEALDSLASSAVLLGCSTGSPRTATAAATTAASIGKVLRSEILRLSQETFALESRIRSLDEQVSRFQTTQPPEQGQEQQEREREQAQNPQRRHLIPTSTSSTLTHPANQNYNYFEPPDDANPPSTPSASAFDTADDPQFFPDTSTLHAQTQHHQRETKQLQLKAQEYNDRIATYQQDANTNINPNANPTVSITTHVAAKQQHLEKQADEIKALETAVRVFHGLPPDVEASREEVRRATGELESLRRKRDGWFEKLGE